MEKGGDNGNPERHRSRLEITRQARTRRKERIIPPQTHKEAERSMSKKYKITVDGTAYQVEVEELGASAPVPAPTASPAAVPAPAGAAEPISAPVPTAVSASGGAGTPVTAPMPGKVLRVAVTSGAAVKNGDLVLVLEAMKMENEIFSPADGIVKEIRARDGETVNTGDVMLIIG